MSGCPTTSCVADYPHFKAKEALSYTFLIMSEPVHEDDGIKLAACNMASKGSTGNFVQHFKEKNTKVWEAQSAEDTAILHPNQTTTSAKGHIQPMLHVWADRIVLICEPFLKVENHPFQCLVTHLRPGYGKSLVKADAEKNCCVSAFEKAEKQFKTILKELVGKKAFVVDAWTSDNNLVYLAIVVCFITNDWEIAQILFDFTHLEGPHTGKNMAKLLEKHIVELGLADNITALAADNTSNNNILREELASMLIDAHRFTVYDPDNMTTHCLLHAIHLAVQAFLLEIKAAEEGDIDEDEIEVSSEWTEEMAEGVTVQDWGMTEKTDQKLLNEQDDNSVDVKAIVQKIQQISKLTHSTPQHSEEFKKTISIMNAVTDDKSRKLHLLNLILDVVTQWNSIYFIVKQTQDLCALMKAVKEFMQSDTARKHESVRTSLQACKEKLEKYYDKLTAESEYYYVAAGKTNTQADPLSHIPTFQVTGAEDNEGQVVLCPERFMSVTAARMKGKELEGRICKGVEKEAEVLQTVEELKKGLQRLVNRLLEWEEDDRLVYYKGKLYIPADKQIDHVVSSCHKECPERVPYMFLMNSDTLPVYISRDNFMILDISPAYAVLFGFEDNTDQLQIQSLRHPNGTGIATTTQHDNI
uniref:Uncharacterized protein n=1 Tax=Moniliophthora roreri TaxID=221103 RepID=A0A0W0G565_MONRR